MGLEVIVKIMGNGCWAAIMTDATISVLKGKPQVELSSEYVYQFTPGNTMKLIYTLNQSFIHRNV